MSRCAGVFLQVGGNANNGAKDGEEAGDVFNAKSPVRRA